MKGLIGHTGFVGTNILKSQNFDLLYNSKNIAHIRGKKLKLLVCAGAPGSMINANKNKTIDRENIDVLIKNISQSRPDRLILISTIGVFNDFSALNDETSKEFEKTLGYGVNRRYLEQILQSKFTKVHIIRLPALFGTGLKKNFIFDILNQAPTFFSSDKFSKLRSKLGKQDKHLLEFYNYEPRQKIYILNRKKLNQSSLRATLENLLNRFHASSIFFHSHDTTYQFYNLENLWVDICNVIENDIPIIHLANEPIKTSEIYKKFYLNDMPATNAAIHHENMITNYSEHWGSNDSFIKNKDSLLDELYNFSLKYSNS